MIEMMATTNFEGYQLKAIETVPDEVLDDLVTRRAVQTRLQDRLGAQIAIKLFESGRLYQSNRHLPEL